MPARCGRRRVYKRNLAALLLSWLSPWAIAATGPAPALHLCVDANDWAPYTYAERDGLAQSLVRMAAARVGVKVEYVARPWKRCEAEVSSGTLDGVVGASEAAARTTPDLLFPRSGAAFDRSRSVVETTIGLLRRAGSPVRWDGKQLHGLQTPVLYVLGYEDVEEWLHTLGVASDGGGSSNEVNGRKLLAGRASVMAIYEYDAQQLLAMPEFRQKIERFESPTGRAYYYLAFGQPYAAAHKAQVEAIWNAVRQERGSTRYQAMQREAGLVVDNPAPR